MSNCDVELEKKKKEREALAKKLELVENEAAIAEMNNKIKFLENAKKQLASMPENNIYAGSPIAN